MDPFQSNKLARILQGHDPRNGMSIGDEEDGDAATSRSPPWGIKREHQRNGAQSWFRRPDGTPVVENTCVQQGGVQQRQEYTGLLNLQKQTVEKQQLRLCVQTLRDHHKEMASSFDMGATSFQTSPRMSAVSSFAGMHPVETNELHLSELHLSVNTSGMEQPLSSTATTAQWTGLAGPANVHTGTSLPVREPPCSTIPRWLTTPKPSLPSSGTAPASCPGGAGRGALLPSTSPNNEPLLPNSFPSQILSYEMWDKVEQDQNGGLAQQPAEQQCKLFGFDLTDKSAPVNVPAAARCEDSEGTGLWSAQDHSPPCSVEQASKPATEGSKGHTVPLRSGTKVSGVFYVLYLLLEDTSVIQVCL